DAFTQESAGMTKKYQGMGLGLAIVKSCLDMNTVALEVDSKQNKGTTFTLTFQKPSESSSRQTKDRGEKIVSEDKQKQRKTVLVVEDDPDAQLLVKLHLKDSYEICFTDTVAGAVEMIKNKRVDLVLLDISLTGNEDGLDFATYVRKSKKWKKLPIIALTAHAFKTDQDNCLKAGCNDFITKPVTKKILLSKIAIVFNSLN
ncbi:MAG: response regulator, partial [Candidatus Neomarinimicrobiota bacterium]